MPTPQQIIAEIDETGHWTAWLAHAPSDAFRADTAAMAIGRLLIAHRWNPGMLEFESSDHQRRVFRLNLTSDSRSASES